MDLNYFDLECNSLKQQIRETSEKIEFLEKHYPKKWQIIGSLTEKINALHRRLCFLLE